MDKPVNFTERISPICLPEATTSSLEQRKIIVTGWGRKYRFGTTVDILRKVEMPVWSLQECKNLYSRFAPGRVLDSNLCAGDGRRDKDACLVCRKVVRKQPYTFILSFVISFDCYGLFNIT